MAKRVNKRKKVKAGKKSTTKRKPKQEQPPDHVITTSPPAPKKKKADGKKVPITTVFVSGASGFVGNAVVTELLRQGYNVIALVRKGSEGKLPQDARLQVRHGDMLDYDSLEDAITGADAIIHLVGIIEEKKGITFEKMHVTATQKMVDAARTKGVSRFIHMSALGTRADAKSRYHITKHKAEEIVRNSGLDFTIFRPSLIFGPLDKSINLFASIISKQPGIAVFPILGKGKLQPVSVEDVARGFVNALRVPESIGQVYDIAGYHAYTLKELVTLVAKVMGKPILTPRIPYHLTRSMVALTGPLAPVSVDQLKMLQEDNVCDPQLFYKTFNIRPRELEPRLREYLRKK